MNLPTLEKADVSGKKVIIRMDLDISDDYTRIEAAQETLDYLLQQNKLILIGHKGRPDKEDRLSLSLKSLVEPLEKILARKIIFVENYKTFDFSQGEVFLLENLRFDPREEVNDEGLAKELANLADFYVNEAFAVSHRAHASIVGIPKKIPHAAGFRLLDEIENLNKVLLEPRRPVVVVISGVKDDKVEMARVLSEKFDKVLVGGKLPIYFGQRSPNPQKIILANLITDGQDITVDSINIFKSEIAKAGTIILAGVLGVYEDEAKRHGTREIFEAVADSAAFKIAGGGDTEAALTIFNLTNKFDWISVGGGAMLEFLAKGTLPGIEALIN